MAEILIEVAPKSGGTYALRILPYDSLAGNPRPWSPNVASYESGWLLGVQEDGRTDPVVASIRDMKGNSTNLAVWVHDPQWCFDWETLYVPAMPDGTTCQLALNPKVKVVRWTDSPDRWPPTETLEPRGTLNVLLLYHTQNPEHKFDTIPGTQPAADAIARTLAPLESDRQLRFIRHPENPSKVGFCLNSEDPTQQLAACFEAVKAHGEPIDLLIYVGHASEKASKLHLSVGLETTRERSAMMPYKDIIDTLFELTHERIKAIFLNACHSSAACRFSARDWENAPSAVVGLTEDIGGITETGRNYAREMSALAEAFCTSICKYDSLLTTCQESWKGILNLQQNKRHAWPGALVVAQRSADSHLLCKPDDLQDFDESAYRERIVEHLIKLQTERAFLQYGSSAKLSGRQLRRNGEIDAAPPFHVPARKMSLVEIQEKYIGYPLDVMELSGQSTTTEDGLVEDAKAHLINTSQGWLVLLLGSPGSGKSYLLREVALSLTGQRRSKSIVPFYLELRDIPSSGFSSLSCVMEFVARSVARLMRVSLAVAYNGIEKILQQGRGFVILDAVDELADPVRPIRSLLSFVRHEKYRKNRFVLSCRTHSQVGGLVGEELLLLPLTEQELRKYFQAVLKGHPTALQGVEKQLHNESFRRHLSTPLVASAYARFAIDQPRLPSSLHDALSHVIRERFRRKQTDPGDDRAFNTTFDEAKEELEDLAHRMRDQLTVSKNRIAVAQNIVEWAEKAGILCRGGEGEVAFALHRYKEFFLAEYWKRQYDKDDRWPGEIQSYLGRIRWRDSFLLLGDIVRDPAAILALFQEYLDGIYAELESNRHSADIVTRSRYKEAVILYGCIGASRLSEGTQGLYFSALTFIHKTAVDPVAPLSYSQRCEVVRSLSDHCNEHAGDVLVALYSDASRFRDAAATKMVQDAARESLARLCVAGQLDGRLTVECERIFGLPNGRRDVAARILKQDPCGRRILARGWWRVAKEDVNRRLVGSFKFLVWVGKAVTAVVAPIAMFKLCILLLSAESPAFIAPIVAVLTFWWAKVRKVSKETPEGSLQETSIEKTMDAGTLAEGPSKNYWFDNPYWTRPKVAGWKNAAKAQKGTLLQRYLLRVAYIGSVALLVGGSLRLGYEIGVLRWFARGCRGMGSALSQTVGETAWEGAKAAAWEGAKAGLPYVAVIVGIAGVFWVGGSILWGVGSIVWAVGDHVIRRWRAAVANRRMDREWAIRLAAASRSAPAARKVAVEETIEKLFDGCERLLANRRTVPKALGVIDARVAAIRDAMLADRRTIARLVEKAEEVREPEVKVLIWALVDEVSRHHVLEEERRLFCQPTRTNSD